MIEDSKETTREEMFSRGMRIALLSGFHSRCGRQSSFREIDKSIGERIICAFDGERTFGRETGYMGPVIYRAHIKNGMVTRIDKIFKDFSGIYRPLSCTDPSDSLGLYLNPPCANWKEALERHLPGWSVEYVWNNEGTAYGRSLRINLPLDSHSEVAYFRIDIDKSWISRGSTWSYAFGVFDNLHTRKSQRRLRELLSLLGMLPTDMEMHYRRIVLG